MTVPVTKPQPASYTYPAVITNIHDGDTAALSVRLRKAPKAWKDTDLGFHIHIEGGWITAHISGRFLGLNADELATPGGKQALAYLKTLISVGDEVTIRSSVPTVQISADKYGNRWDVVIVRKDGLNVNQKMIDSGHAKPWDGQGEKPTT